MTGAAIDPPERGASPPASPPSSPSPPVRPAVRAAHPPQAQPPQAHETTAFRHAVEYTVALRYVVAGTARPTTADRRARGIARKLANAAARLRDVVEVTATAGRTHRGRLLTGADVVRFDAANTGHGATLAPALLDRYVDPDRERAQASLQAVNAADQARREVDRQRRRVFGCANVYAATSALGVQPAQDCRCAYCDPEEHERALALDEGSRDGGLHLPRCLCGLPVVSARARCPRHVGTPLVVLDTDGAALHRLADRLDEDGPTDGPIDGPGDGHPYERQDERGDRRHGDDWWA